MKTLRYFSPFILLIFSVVLLFHQLCQSALIWKDIKPTEEMVIKWESHVQPLREALPSNIKQVGYLDSSVVLDTTTLFEVEEFLLMQYSMAPVVVEIGSRHQWIIGNFDNDTNFQHWLDENVPKHEIQNFGFSLYLIKNLSINTP